MSKFYSENNDECCLGTAVGRVPLRIMGGLAVGLGIIQVSLRFSTLIAWFSTPNLSLLCLDRTRCLCFRLLTTCCLLRREARRLVGRRSPSDDRLILNMGN